MLRERFRGVWGIPSSENNIWLSLRAGNSPQRYDDEPAPYRKKHNFDECGIDDAETTEAWVSKRLEKKLDRLYVLTPKAVAGIEENLRIIRGKGENMNCPETAIGSVKKMMRCEPSAKVPTSLCSPGIVRIYGVHRNGVEYLPFRGVSSFK